MSRHEAAGQDHEKQGDHDRENHDAALRREIIPGQAGRLLDPALPVTIAQRHTDQPAGEQTHGHRAELEQHIARHQYFEECLDTLHDFRHAFRSGMSWLSNRAI